MRRVKGRLLIVMCFALFAAGAYGDDFTITQQVFLPPKFYVGDPVELRLRVHLSDEVVLAEPSAMPEGEAITVHGVRIIPIADDYDIRIRFTTYEPGSRRLPAMTFGDISIDGLEIQTASVLEEGETQFIGAFDPILLPGSRILFAVSAGAAVLGPLLLVLLTVFSSRAIRLVLSKIAAKRPIKLLERSLDLLIENPHSLSVKSRYFELNELFRIYLTNHTGENFNSATAREAKEMLCERYSEFSSAPEVTSFLESIDAFTFGVRKAGAKRLARDVAVIRAAALELEAL